MRPDELYHHLIEFTNQFAGFTIVDQDGCQRALEQGDGIYFGGIGKDTRVGGLPGHRSQNRT